MLDRSQTEEALEFQADIHERMGAHFGAELLRRAAADVRANGPVAALLAPWKDDDARRMTVDAVPIRLLGALNDLALEGVEPEFTALSPPATMPPIGSASGPSSSTSRGGTPPASPPS
jgi:hypothetical protein